MNLTNVVLQSLNLTAGRNKYTSFKLEFVIYNSMYVPLTTALAASHKYLCVEFNFFFP